MSQVSFRKGMTDSMFVNDNIQQTILSSQQNTEF